MPDLVRAAAALERMAAALGIVEGAPPTPRTLVELQGDYTSVRRDYEDRLHGIILEYLVGGEAVTRYRNQVRQLVTSELPFAFRAGYFAGGAEDLDAEDQAWLDARVDAELGHVDLLFESLRALRQEKPNTLAFVEAATARSTGYAATLDAVFSEGLLRGQRNQMLTLVGSDGAESCRTCQSLKNKRHSARWWIAHGLIPGQPGNPNYECRGYLCQHYLVDDAGQRWTR